MRFGLLVGIKPNLEVDVIGKASYDILGLRKQMLDMPNDSGFQQAMLLTPEGVRNSRKFKANTAPAVEAKEEKKRGKAKA